MLKTLTKEIKVSGRDARSTSCLFILTVITGVSDSSVFIAAKRARQRHVTVRNRPQFLWFAKEPLLMSSDSKKPSTRRRHIINRAT